jgi:predicted TIM-barrel fold metal-dependent hydrolase
MKLNWQKSELHGLLPDPEPRQVVHTLISVDDHLVEPPHMFEGRLPAHLQEQAPRVVETEEGHEVWEFDGQVFFQVGMNAVAGRPREDWLIEPTRFDEMRPGCWDPDERVRDMDINGVWAAVNFPSQISGFCGRVFAQCSDPELGAATVRAWNDWFFSDWYGSHPDRFVPLGITFLGDAELGAAEIRRNAERGFVAITLPEQPHRVGLPAIYDEWWEPILRACAETDTVVCLHVGSTGVVDMPPGAPMVALAATLFGQLSLAACAEWLWSPWPRRFPELRIAMSEGGIGWVAMLHDRLENIVDRSGYGAYFDGELRPAEVLRRNFWFCTLDDPSTIDTREVVGVDRIMWECDYPHGDGTWPDSQQLVSDVWGHLPPDELARLTHENAAALFRHPLPPPGHRLAAGLRVP